tara:strand:+ start:1174 stop:2043 length:870 start_codon:yes stop_codon:yes gene_type:complete
MKKILIFGGNGMLGSELASYLVKKNEFKIYLTVRNLKSIRAYNFVKKCKIYHSIDVLNNFIVEKIIKKTKPDIILNCIGLIKQKFNIKNSKNIFLVNSLFPRYLSYLSKIYKYRLIHFSTDCVFSGRIGNYTEQNFCDADDYYGISKFLGEDVDEKNVIIRTSIIGHELNSKKSFLNWFLNQKGSVRGYSKSIFSGFPTYELAKIVYVYFIKNQKLKGLFHLSSNPISKYDLLLIIKKVYNKRIKIFKDKKVIVDRSMNSTKFRDLTKFKPRLWSDMIHDMYNFQNIKN